MKRLSLLITMFVLAISQLSAQDNSNTGTITLSHKGKETNFAYNKMGDAVEAAADGDTIYLSNGEFEGDFRLTKKIAFIGRAFDDNWELNDPTGKSDDDVKDIIRKIEEKILELKNCLQ